MKRNFLLLIITISIAVLLVSNCNKARKQPKNITSIEEDTTARMEVFDTVEAKNQIVEIIQKAPKAAEIAEKLNEAGASYIYALTIPLDDVEKMMTSIQKAIGVGILSFDIKYASVYKRGDVVVKTRDYLNQLESGLELQEDLLFAEKYQKRIERNRSNSDSINFFTTQLANDFHQYMQNGAHADIYAFASIGANIEALYILSQMTLLAKNNDKLLVLMNNQNQRIKLLSSLLEIMSGSENVKPYYNRIQPLLQFFIEKDTIKKDDLNKIAPLIEKVRNGLIQE
jgi:hypothetical protein